MAASCCASIMKEVKRLIKKPLDDIEIKIKNDNISILTAIITGPESTPFETGKFEIALHFTNNYPQQPPKGYFITKIFHPNVAPSNGEICVNTLKKDWKPSYGIKHILIAIRSLLIVPNYDSALNEEAGKLLLTSYQLYVDRAKLFTRIHSIPIDTNHNKQKQMEDENMKDKTKDRNTNGGDKENVNGTKTEKDKGNEVMNKCLNQKEKERNKENDGNGSKCDENNPNNKMNKSKSKSKGKSKGKSKKSKVSKSMRRL